MFIEPNDWQHDVFLQSLYSVRAAAPNAPDWDYYLAQARSDVFFSLLLGGRIISSAGSFFDSPIAIRIFGELFSHDEATAKLFNKWRPLLLCTDNPESAEPRSYFAGRLLQGKGLILFREDDETFVEKMGGIKAVQNLKSEIGQYLRDGNKDTTLDVTFEKFRIDYEPHRMRLGQPTVSRKVIFDKNPSEWLPRIFQYLNEYSQFAPLASNRHSLLQQFSPFKALDKRVQELLSGGNSSDQVLTISEMNKEFDSKQGDGYTTHNFHELGPSIYGKYMDLVNYWIEKEWHAFRHSAYETAIYRQSSAWIEGNLLDIDVDSNVTYASKAKVRDDVLKKREAFGKIDWSILFSLVTDSEFRKSMQKARRPNRTDGLSEIIEILSKKVSDFQLRQDGSALYLALRTFSTPTVIGGLLGGFAGAMTTHFAPNLAKEFVVPHAKTTSMFGGSVLGALAARRSRKEAIPLIPGVRQLHEAYTLRSLRSAAIPYLNSELLDI